MPAPAPVPVPVPVPVAGCATAPPRCTTRGWPTSSLTEPPPPLPPPPALVVVVVHHHHHHHPHTPASQPAKAARPRNKRCRALYHPCPHCLAADPYPPVYDVQLPITKPHERQRSVPARPLLVGGFLHRTPPAPMQPGTGLHVHASLTFSFEKDTLVPASTPDPSPFRFASSSSSPSSERLASRGTAPLCPGACLGLLALEGSHASRCVTNRFQILEGYHVSLRSPSALAVVHTPSL